MICAASFPFLSLQASSVCIYMPDALEVAIFNDAAVSNVLIESLFHTRLNTVGIIPLCEEMRT